MQWRLLLAVPALAVMLGFLLTPASLFARPPLEHAIFGPKPKGWNEFIANSPHEQRGESPLAFQVAPGKEFPKWLKGRMMRNSAALHTFGQRSATNLFDGLAKVLSIRFDGTSTAKFQARFVESGVYNETLRRGGLAPTVYLGGVEPPFTLVEQLESRMRRLGPNANVNVMSLGEGKPFILLTDTSEMWLMDQDLNTIGRAHFSDEWAEIEKKGIPNFGPAHPVQLGSEFFTVVVNADRKATLVRSETNTLAFVSFDHTLKRKTLASMKLEYVPYFHSVAATESTMIGLVTPFEFSPLKILMSMRLIDGGLNWNPNRETYIVVGDKATGTMRKFLLEPQFCFHPPNAYETPYDIIVDYALYLGDIAKDVYKFFDFREMQRGRPTLKTEPILRRYFISKTNSSITHKDFPNGAGIEFPRINENYSGKPYCIVYGVVLHREKVSLLKANLCTGERLEWLPPNETPFIAEPLFAANPTGLKEDDGVILTSYLDGETKETFQVVLDAATLTTIASAKLPWALGFPFHGSYIPTI